MNYSAFPERWTAALISYINIPKFNVTVIVALSVVLNMICQLLIDKQRHRGASCFKQPRKE